MIGIVNTIGMILFGIIADKRSVDKVLSITYFLLLYNVQVALYGVSTTLCGVCIFLMPWVYNYELLMTLAACFGKLV